MDSNVFAQNGRFFRPFFCSLPKTKALCFRNGGVIMLYSQQFDIHQLRIPEKEALYERKADRFAVATTE